MIKKYIHTIKFLRLCFCIQLPLQSMQLLREIETKITNFFYQDDRAIGEALKKNDFKAIDTYIKKWGMEHLNMARKMYGLRNPYGDIYYSQPILIRALAQHKPDMIQHLIDHNADVNVTTDNGVSVLSMTLNYLTQEGTDTIRDDYMAILRTLVRHGASIDGHFGDTQMTDFLYAGCTLPEPYNLEALKLFMQWDARPSVADLISIGTHARERNDIKMKDYTITLLSYYQRKSLDRVLECKYPFEDAMPDMFDFVLLDEDIYVIRSLFARYNQINLNDYFERMYRLKKKASCAELLFLAHFAQPQQQLSFSESTKINADKALASTLMHVKLKKMHDNKKLYDICMHFV